MVFAARNSEIREAAAADGVELHDKDWEYQKWEKIDTPDARERLRRWKHFRSWYAGGAPTQPTQSTSDSAEGLQDVVAATPGAELDDEARGRLQNAAALMLGGGASAAPSSVDVRLAARTNFLLGRSGKVNAVIGKVEKMLATKKQKGPGLKGKGLKGLAKATIAANKMNKLFAARQETAGMSAAEIADVDIFEEFDESKFDIPEEAEDKPPPPPPPPKHVVQWENMSEDERRYELQLAAMDADVLDLGIIDGQPLPDMEDWNDLGGFRTERLESFIQWYVYGKSDKTEEGAVAGTAAGAAAATAEGGGAMVVTTQRAALLLNEAQCAARDEEISVAAANDDINELWSDAPHCTSPSEGFRVWYAEQRTLRLSFLARQIEQAFASRRMSAASGLFWTAAPVLFQELPPLACDPVLPPPVKRIRLYPSRSPEIYSLSEVRAISRVSVTKRAACVFEISHEYLNEPLSNPVASPS